MTTAPLVTIEHPSGDEKGYCVVLGNGGIEHGLVVYRGDEGLACYLGMVTGAIDDESEEMLDMTNALSALLADRDEVPKDDRDLIRSLGLRYRGRGRWPLFQAMKPGYLPSGLQADEAAFLAIALRSMTELASSVEKIEVTLGLEDERESKTDLFLTRSLVNGEWQNRWESLLFPVPPPSPDYPHLERLQRLADSKPRTGSVWELSIFFLHLPTGQDSEGRLYFPTFSLLVESGSGAVVPDVFMGPNPSDTDRQELLVRQLESLPELPSEIVVNAPRIGRIVESVTAPLGITLSVGETPAPPERQGRVAGNTRRRPSGFLLKDA